MEIQGKSNLGLVATFQYCDVGSHKLVVAENQQICKNCSNIVCKAGACDQDKQQHKEGVRHSHISCSECIINLCLDSKKKC